MLKKLIEIVTALVISLVCVNVSTIASKAQGSRYIDEKIPGTKWIYSDNFVSGVLNQCRVGLDTQAVNGSHSFITVDVLSKGSLVLAIRDDDWKNQINLTFGWSVGKEFDKVLLHLKDGRLATSGKIALPEVFLIGLPKDQEILLEAFFASEDMGVSVEGLIYKAWNTPRLSKAWQRLKKCNLLKQ
jgi:hypothetical protein